MPTIPFRQLKLKSTGFENPRRVTGLDEESIRELAEDISARGLLYPILVWPFDNLVVGGQRRYRAIQLLIKEGRAGELENAVPIEYYEGDDIHGVALADGLLREDLSTYEVAEALSKLKSPQVEIAKRVGKSTAWVSRHLKAWKQAHPELKHAWQAGEVTLDRVLELCDLNPVDQRARLMEVELPKKRAPIKRPKLARIREIALEEPEDDYQQGVRDLADYAANGEIPNDERFSKYLK